MQVPLELPGCAGSPVLKSVLKGSYSAICNTFLNATEMLNTSIQFTVADTYRNHFYSYADASISHSFPSPPILIFLC